MVHNYFFFFLISLQIAKAVKSRLGINLNSYHTFRKNYQPVIHCMVILTTNYKKKSQSNLQTSLKLKYETLLSEAKTYLLHLTVSVSILTIFLPQLHHNGKASSAARR